MKKQEINRFFTELSNVNCLIIGDLMIDSYRWGSVNRISPEAPVPIIAIENKEDRLGGAANVALNINSLGATPIVCGVCGNDDSGKILKSLFEKENISSEGIISLDTRRTTVKTRIIGGTQHLLRMDEEDDHALLKDEENLVFQQIGKLISSNRIDVIIFEDYDKGLLQADLIKRVIELAKSNGIRTTVDPKKENFNNYIGVDLFKPNLKELIEGLKLNPPKNPDELIDTCYQFSDEKNIKHLLLTMSEHGILITQDSNKHYKDPAHKRDIADVSGAGDTVIAVASLALALNLDFTMIAALSNLAGGLVCEKVGVIAIERDILHNEALRVLIH